MKIITSIRNLLKHGSTQDDAEHHSQKDGESSTSSHNDHMNNPVKLEPGLEFLDGMSTGTAGFIIDREISPELLHKYDVKDLENKGRYYLAKIVNQDGKVADTVI